MRAHDRKPASKKRAVARARFRLQTDFAWLRGHPVQARKGAVEWLVVPAPGDGLPATITIDREFLRKAVFRRNKLIRDFPRALPELVGDVDAWRAATDALLAPLKAAVHEGAALPDAAERGAANWSTVLTRRFADLRNRLPSLRDALDAVAWQVADRKLASKMLRAIETHATTLTRLAAEPGTLAMLIELLAADGDKARNLLDQLTDPDLELAQPQPPMPEIGDTISELNRRFDRKKKQAWPQLPLPEGRMHRRIVRWLEVVYVLERPARKRALALLELLWPEDLGTQWSRYHARIEGVRKRADAWFETVPRTAEGQKMHLERRIATLNRLGDQHPPITSRGFANAVVFWIDAMQADRSLASDLLSALDHTPIVQSRTLARVRLLCAWHKLADHQNVTDRQLRDHIRRTARHLGTGDRARAFAPWHEGMGRNTRWECLPLGTPWSPLPHDRPEELWRLLAHLRDAAELPLDPPVLELAGDLHDHTGECAAETMRFLGPIVAAGRAKEALDLDHDTQAALCRITRDDPAQWLAVADELVPLELEWSTWRAIRNLSVSKRPRFLVDAIVHGERSRVMELAHVSQWQLKPGADSIELTWPGRRLRTTPTWLRRYPAPLRAPLAELATLDDDAESVAADLLRRDFPDRRRLRRELQSLEHRLAESSGAKARGMEQRAARLRESLTTRRTVTARRLTNLTAKLRRRIAATALQRMIDRAVSELHQQLSRHLTADAVRFVESTPQAFDLLPHILNEQPEIRALAFRLLEARAGSAPWDLRDVPDNDSFVRRMKRRGIDMDAWLSDAIEEHATRGGATLRLQLEPDPLEVFLMGRHFSTCLSPGEMNFFSAIVNAGDVNKRVLYARDTRGNVRGRRLLALSDTGEILAFYAYSHDPKLEFDALSSAFTKRLAKRMRTSVRSSGHVPRILTSKWYDDGAYHFAGQDGWLEMEGSLAKMLPTARPGDLRAAIAQHTNDDLGPGDLYSVLWHLRRAERADLVPTLDPWLDRRAEASTLALAAGMLRRAGLESRRILARIPSTRRAFRAQDHDRLNSILLEYVEWNPSRTLHALRWTRQRDVRSFADECCFERRFAAARAYEKLNRLRGALELYRAARAIGKNRPECTEPLRRLGKLYP